MQKQNSSIKIGKKKKIDRSFFFGLADRSSNNKKKYYFCQFPFFSFIYLFIIIILTLEIRTCEGGGERFKLEEDSKSMTGRTLTPTATDVIINIGSGVRQQVSASVLNSYRMAAVSERLTSFVKSGQARDPVEFYNLLLSLSRGIDYAVANNEVPNNVLELPLLLKQICRRHNDPVSRGVILVLMMSVKNACMQGWFQAKETEELIFLENELGSTFRSMSDTNIGSSSCHSIMKTVMERFYPRMKIGEILASLDAKPGFRGYNLDFHISKNSGHSPDEKICLFVAQVDILETSSCIISPQQVDFLLNGKHVDRRTNVFMDPGPQMPTNVTPLLKYGTNLLQAVGRFNGPCIIVIAFMSVMPSLETPVLQDYVQPVVASDSDADIIEGPSRISLNCPISYKRIRTPVKGHSCKHLQCFDLKNFLTINLRRPSWRCPHCNQSVCYLDIRIDQNMVKVLKEVGEDVADVTISSDGSWKTVLEDNKNSNQAHEKALDSTEGSPEKLEHTNLSNGIPNVVDLTEDKNEMEMDCTYEIQDRKPFQDSLRSAASDLSGGVSVQHSFIANLEDEFLRGVHTENGMETSVARSDNQLVGGVSLPRTAILQASPMHTGDISLELSREAENHVNVCPPASEMASQVSSPNNLHSEQLQIVNSNASNEYGRFPTISRVVSRTPVAVQALPAQAQTADSQHRLRTNLNSSSSSVPSIASQVGPSPSNGHNFVNTDVELRQHISRSRLGPSQTPNLRPTAQIRHHIPPHRMSSGLGVFQNQHLQQALNPRMSQPISPNVMRSSSPFSRTPVQLGSAQVGTSQRSGTGNSQLTSPRNSTMSGQSPTLPVSRPRIGSTLPANPDAYRTPAVDQRGVMGGTRAVVGADGLSDLLPEQEPRPAGRMRGSVTDQVYSAALNQLHMQQNHRAHPVRSPSNLSTPTPIVPSHLQMLIANRNAQASQRQNTNNSQR